MRNVTIIVALIVAVFVYVTHPARAAEPTEDMQALIKAARAEGQVEVLLSGAVPQKLAVLMPDFEEKYGVRVNFQRGAGNAYAQRILAERRVGRYTLDAWLGGDTTALTVLIPNGALAPIPELLIDPEVTDLSNWYKGRHYYTDPDQRYVFAFGVRPIQLISFNTKLVDPREIRSYQDLLHPKWKGKMVSWNPAAQGAGATAVGMYLHPRIGEEWFRRWASEMNVTMVADARQGAEWLALGRFHLGIFGLATEVEAMSSQGFPVQAEMPHSMSEGEILTLASTNIMVMDRPRNPKAAQLFVNWLLTRDVQQKLIKIAERADTLRTDVNNEVIDAAYRRKPDVDYFVPFVEPRYQNEQDEILKRIGEILKQAGYR